MIDQRHWMEAPSIDVEGARRRATQARPLAPPERVDERRARVGVTELVRASESNLAVGREDGLDRGMVAGGPMQSDRT